MQLAHDGKQWSNATEDRVLLATYNSEWPRLYQDETTRLAAVLPDGLAYRFEHFGSTSIPDLSAKPIIDILLLVDDTQQWPQLIQPLQSLDYIYWDDNPRSDRMFFVKGMPPFGKGRTHHVHVRQSKDAENELLFRDYLKLHADEREKYEMLKRQLSRQNETDREAYTHGKDEFIVGVLAKAREFKSR